MAFRDLDDFLVVPPLVLPIRGKDYSFPGEVSARSWLRLQKLSDQMRGDDVDAEAMSDAEEAELEAEMFGDVKAEMIADGLTSSHIRIVFYTLIAFHLSGREVAEMIWNSQGEAPAPSRATRRKPAAKKPSTRSRGSAAGSSSRNRSRKSAAPGAASSGAGRS